MVNILIAEDDKDDFLMLEEAIETILPDFQITHSRNGRDFLQNIETTYPPDLIFLDLNMPKMNGIDCLINIRQKEGFQSVPVVVYSTSSDFEDINQCYKNGCTLYMVKPGSFKDLVVQMKKLFLHKEMEEALLKTQEHFNLFIKASSERVFKMSADWKKIFVLAGKDILSATEPIGTAWLQEGIPVEDRKEISDAIAYAITTKSIFEMEHRILKEDGSIGWAFSRVIPALDDHGNLMEWFGTTSDITARKNAEEELKKEHYFLEQITDNTPHLIYVFDFEEQRFIYVNKRIQFLTGISPEYVYGMGEHLYKMIIHPDDLAKRIEYMRSLATLQAGDIREHEFRVKVGEGYRWFRSKDHVFKMDGNRLSQIIGLAEDVTYEKRLQETLLSETGTAGLN